MSSKNLWLFVVSVLFGTQFVAPAQSQGLKDPFLQPPLEPISSSQVTSQVSAPSLPSLKANDSRMIVETIKLEYAVAEEMVNLINRAQLSRLLSESGSISFDERTNTIVVRDRQSSIQEIRAIIKQFDIPVKQVQIEARIVIINEGDLHELGVRWGVSSQRDNIKVGGSIEGNLDLEEEKQNLSDHLNVNLGSVSPNSSSIAFQIARLGSSTLLDLELSALQSESRAEVISSPRLLTLDKKPAYIEQGTEIPYLESSDNENATVSFRKAVLSLKVTPQISQDNQIVLDLLVTQDRPGQVVKTGSGEAVAIDTQRIETQVRVTDGETIALGGIFQQAQISSVDKVPLLGDIPVIGRLFSRSYSNQTKSELVIFVTPVVLNDERLEY
jgi:type IV pilus assembly protein PilQ